ncbi:MAG: DUF501 domain-containing protein [Planctomycetota bacterium]
MTRQRKFRDLRTEDFIVAEDGEVLVRRCYPVRMHGDRPTPFPTLYWLAGEALVKHISHVEREGWIKRLEAEIAADPELTAAFRADHARYIEQRWALLDEEDRALVRRFDMEADLRERGIGGLLDFGKIKCLHLQYAHHLADANTVGRLLEERGLLTRPKLAPS